MLRNILFSVEFFADEAERANSQKRVLCLLEALVWCNRLYLQQHPETPLIYQSGIKYKVPAQFEKEQVPEVDAVGAFLKKKGAPANVAAAFKTLSDMCGGGENFREIPRIIENGGGDCDNVASWRAAELRELGIDASPYITWKQRPDGGYTYHVIVRWPDGSAEDPSLLLGMGGPGRDADRREEERKLGERCAEFIKVLSGGISKPTDVFGAVTRRHRERRALTKMLGSVTTAQDFNQLQYSIPFQTDDELYEDWSPSRPQGFYNNPYYPNLPSTPGGVPMFNTILGDLPVIPSHRSQKKIERAIKRHVRRQG